MAGISLTPGTAFLFSGFVLVILGLTNEWLGYLRQPVPYEIPIVLSVLLGVLCFAGVSRAAASASISHIGVPLCAMLLFGGLFLLSKTGTFRKSRDFEVLVLMLSSGVGAAYIGLAGTILSAAV